MNKTYKWKLTKSTFRLVIVSAVAFLGLCLFGLSDLTQLYGMPGYFYITEVPHYIFTGIKDSFVTNYSYMTLINLIPIGLFLIAGLLCLLTLIFKLKPSNLITFVLLVLGAASLLCVTSIGFVFIRDKELLKQLMDLALFKQFKTDFMTVVPALGIWIYVLALVSAVVCYFIFLYYVIKDSFNKKPRLKGEAKYYYDHYDKKDLAKLACAQDQVAQAVVQAQQVPNQQVITTPNAVRQNVVVRAPRPRKPVINNITVSRGTPMPERSTNVVQFVHCDDTFVDQVKSKEEKAKGATFLDVQRY